MFNPEEGIILAASRRERDAPGTRFWSPGPDDYRFRQAWEQDIANDGGRDLRFRATYRPELGGFDPAQWPQALDYRLADNRLEGLLANKVGDSFHARLGDGNAPTATGFSFRPPDSPDQGELQGKGRIWAATRTQQVDQRNRQGITIHSVAVIVVIEDEKKRRRITSELHRQAQPNKQQPD